MYAQASELHNDNDSTLPGNAPQDIVSAFWQQWQQHQDELYRCCLRLMNFNPVDAEDALSQAMLKAWEKAQAYAGKIANFKAWLMQLTRNLCIDIIRARSRGAAGVEDIEWVGTSGELATATAVETPEKALEREEKTLEIRRAIADLPPTLRDTFVLHFCEELTNPEIAAWLGISYDSVCKRISRARKQLKEKLSGYCCGEEAVGVLVLERQPSLLAFEEKQQAFDTDDGKTISRQEDFINAAEPSGSVKDPVQFFYPAIAAPKASIAVEISETLASEHLQFVHGSDEITDTEEAINTESAAIESVEAIAVEEPKIVNGSENFRYQVGKKISLSPWLRETVLCFDETRSHPEGAQRAFYDKIYNQIALSRQKTQGLSNDFQETRVRGSPQPTSKKKEEIIPIRFIHAGFEALKYRQAGDYLRQVQRTMV